MSNFECWLSDRLDALRVDSEVFSSYIQGILEGDEKHDEKTESIQDILESASTESVDIAGVTQEIIRMYNEQSGLESSIGTSQALDAATEDGQEGTFEDKVRTIFSKQNAKASESANKRKASSTEEREKLRSSILSQYAEVEVASAENAEEDIIKASAGQLATPALNPKDKRKNPPSSSDPLLMKNTNAQQVLDAEKLKRERSKQESEAKKVKDKTDRENQKKKEAERREKEKQRTQKGERRR
ncbi:coiled-coil domain-containing protein 43 [Galendromus occidentalis]|uniref:Coiled-coil domain-containing protein 43 n=1 Tax=Galendromus occidentalis TaxID=34638 RepID=A0AAJ6QUB0_9ACAR|nr:coiled-coil domain-containing protein 43 [Galendromus occidentalis]